MRTPLTFAWRNVVFARDVHDAWALYRVHTRSYAGLPTAAKIEVLASVAAFATAIERDFQLLRVSRAWSPLDYADAARSTIDGRHGQPDLLDDLLAGHERALQDAELARPEVFLAVRLADARPAAGSRSSADSLGLSAAGALTQRKLDRYLDAEAGPSRALATTSTSSA